MNFFPEPRKHLVKIPAYSAGKTAKDLGKSTRPMIKLSSNEATWGSGDAVINALKRYLYSVHLYPNSQSTELRELLAKANKVKPENIILGNGSNEIIQFILQAYVNPDENILVPSLTFSMYKIYAEMSNIKVREVLMGENFEISLENLKRRMTKKTKAIFLASPNNPTGLLLQKMELELFLMGLKKNMLAVIDEAYADFSDPALKPDFCAMIRNGNYPNLVLLRTFSKAYGMAGLRLGYGIASDDVIQNLHRVRQPFNVNGLAIAAAIAALENPHHKLDIVTQTRLGRNFIEQKLKSFKIPFLPSQANFLMVFVKDGKIAFDALAKRDLIVRELTSFGLPEYIRVTASNPEHNRKFVNALSEALS